MRATATLVAFVLTVPTLAAVALPTPDVHAPLDFALLPHDLPDGMLLRMLAFETGVELPRGSQAVVVPVGETIPDVVTRLAARVGEPLAREEVEAFLALDPAVATPTLAMLLAVERAWTLRDQAMHDIDEDELAELAAYVHDTERRGHPTQRELDLMAQVDRRAMFTAALVLLDTLDTFVMPQLQAAVDTATWPTTPTEDRVGILRINTPGNDFDDKIRIVQIDPSGDDVWKNPAGASTILQDLNTATLETPIGISLDFGGHDTYDFYPMPSCQGGGMIGVGILMDTQGNDSYRGDNDCQGAGWLGVGYFRDMQGNDAKKSFQFSTGAGSGLGVHRDDAGDDTYDVASGSGGAASLETSLGLLWDRDGTDHYKASTSAAFGFADYSGGRGWLVDEGPGTDYYSTQFAPAGIPHGCNDCRWGPTGYWANPPRNIVPPNGRGNDNAGGLAALMAEDGSLFHLGDAHVP